jgi:sulfide:quinone oxidoreductase
VATFKSIFDKFPTPIFAYCRTGTRSTNLWSLAKANELSSTKILAITQSAGYDMADVVKRIVEGGSDTPID